MDMNEINVFEMGIILSRSQWINLFYAFLSFLLVN